MDILNNIVAIDLRCIPSGPYRIPTGTKISGRDLLTECNVDGEAAAPEGGHALSNIAEQRERASIALSLPRARYFIPLSSPGSAHTNGPYRVRAHGARIHEPGLTGEGAPSVFCLSFSVSVPDADINQTRFARP